MYHDIETTANQNSRCILASVTPHFSHRAMHVCRIDHQWPLYSLWHGFIMVVQRFRVVNYGTVLSYVLLAIFFMEDDYENSVLKQLDFLPSFLRVLVDN